MNLTTIHPTTKQTIPPISADTLITLVQPKTAMEQVAQYTAMAAHEIRNPLSTISLAAEMLKTMITDDDQKVFLDIILRGSGRINGILTDLFTSSKPKEVLPETHSILQLLDEVLQTTEDKIVLKHVAVTKNYAAEDYKIQLDRPKMKIALTNIIINAIDAMSSEKGELKLTTKLLKGQYVLQIKDNGCGISKVNLKYIFKPYFTNKEGGVGLGLATTYDILWENHVGVNVESEEGAGTNFILLLDKNQSNTNSNKTA